MSTISQENLDFLKDLKNNNNREWFTKNKSVYEKFYNETVAFADAVINELRKHDHIENVSGKKSLMRIYRDVRFSKDKSPYKSNWGMGFSRATKLLRGGYYVHLEPNGCFVGGGFWNPNPADLLRMRKEISINPKEFRAILNDKAFRNTFGELFGEKLKTIPKGFEKDDEAIDLLQFKQFLISKKFTNKEVTAPDFYKKVDETFQTMRPFFDFMSVALTTNENGELLPSL